MKQTRKIRLVFDIDAHQDTILSPEVVERIWGRRTNYAEMMNDAETLESIQHNNALLKALLDRPDVYKRFLVSTLAASLQVHISDLDIIRLAGHPQGDSLTSLLPDLPGASMLHFRQAIDEGWFSEGSELVDFSLNVDFVRASIEVDKQSTSLEEKVGLFEEAQRELFNELGISRRQPDGTHSKTGNLRHTVGSGNQDIPTHYPHLLDYRSCQWKATSTDQNRDEEIHVKIRGDHDWEPENIIRFNVLATWDVQGRNGTVCAACTHLPKPEELEYARPDDVAAAAQGDNIHGDECLLLLDTSLGYSEHGELGEYFE